MDGGATSLRKQNVSRKSEAKSRTEQDKGRKKVKGKRRKRAGRSGRFRYLTVYNPVCLIQSKQAFDKVYEKTRQ